MQSRETEGGGAREVASGDVCVFAGAGGQTVGSAATGGPTQAATPRLGPVVAAAVHLQPVVVLTCPQVGPSETLVHVDVRTRALVVHVRTHWHQGGVSAPRCCVRGGRLPRVVGGGAPFAAE